MDTKFNSRHLIERFYCELDRLADDYEELTDTDVREALHLTLNYFFIWGMKSSIYPISYGMFSLEGDRAVARSVENFLEGVHSCSEMSNTPVGQPRLNLLQNFEIKTPSGRQYDEFIGHADKPLPQEPLPDYLFSEGDYD